MSSGKVWLAGAALGLELIHGTSANPIENQVDPTPRTELVESIHEATEAVIEKKEEPDEVEAASKPAGK